MPTIFRQSSAVRSSRSRARVLVLGIVLSCALVPAREIAGQIGGAQRATRTELTSRLQDLERQISTSNTRKDELAKARVEASAIRTRLSDGDFRVGDRFIATIRTDSVRGDTLVVRDSMKVAVFNLPEMTMAGVLRSELEQHLSEHVAKFLRYASVRTAVLTRVSVTGAVVRPGIYYVAPDRPVIDVITIAGGPAAQSNLDRLEIRRGTSVLFSGKKSERLVKTGGTLEQADVRSGDEIRVPMKRRVNWQMVIQLFFVFSSLFFAFLQFIQWYYNRKDS